MTKKYDAIIIGAGMSGLAASIRLLMFGKKVCLLEKHSIPGGLNSYYTRGKRNFDVGLHALTNFIKKGERGKPLSKLLKQLRIPYDALELSPQIRSEIKFPARSLEFTNELEEFVVNIKREFPYEIDGFLKLLEYINEYNEVSLANKFILAKDVLRKFINSEELIEMIMCPLLIYGSAWENDMDFSQFVIMFKSIYIEGFSRPKGGVRTIINILVNKIEELGGDIHYKSEVKKILTKNNKVYGIVLQDEKVIESDVILSSMGLLETQKVTSGAYEKEKQGNLSFTESIIISNKKPKDFNYDTTIVFFNNNKKYHYEKPTSSFDPQSAVICLPNNFHYDDSNEGIYRVTNIANFNEWNNLERKTYLEEKNLVFKNALTMIKSCIHQFDGDILFKDVFSPTTIKKYTSHFGGTVYGSTDKKRNGKTETDGLYLIGTDQGFLGIVGSMLSGISMANLYGLMEEKPGEVNAV